MRLPLLFPIAALWFLLLGGCAHKLDPAMHRPTTPVSDPTKTISVLREISSNTVVGRERRRMSLPVGTYQLEAEDADYWYFQAPTPVGFHLIEEPKIVEKRQLPGGLRLPKRSNAAPPAGYLDAGPTGKELIAELTGTEFAWMEGRYWKKNF